MAEIVESTTFGNPLERGLASSPKPRATGPRVVSADTVNELLQSLDEAAAECGLSATERSARSPEGKLARARLGMASGLFAALRAKHPPTASHSLRVALGCSSWAAFLQLEEKDRDELEVAALLHDIGKIGIPDAILLKPGRLSPEEAAQMAKHVDLSVEVLASSGASAAVLDLVRYGRVWFHGKGREQDRSGENLPLGSRMLAIVDAFDSMTTEQIYRPARSRERALAELFACAGRQFDPELVRKFQEFFSQSQELLTDKLARHWLQGLKKEPLFVPWTMTAHKPYEVSPSARTEIGTSLFEMKLIENMHDGVVFVDSQSKILLWNTGVERLTGVSSEAAHGRTLLPSLMDMRNEHDRLLKIDECPVARAIGSGVQWLGRVKIMGRHGQQIAVNLQAIPVRGTDGLIHGATLLLHDASSETSLEERCQALHAQAAKDPMTQVSNRAEFDRMLEHFVTAHFESHMPCSLIMCDIDHFKLINDTHGHQAGDTAIITFASLLKTLCRTGDLVARYGGEEFVILCANCTNAAAARKAETIRKGLAEVKHKCLGNESFTASFGVTELQTGDTPESFLRRADRALLQAKDQGRNQVVQLGDGMADEKTRRSWWPFQTFRGSSLVEASLVSMVPIDIAIQKLRGFISDHNAKIVQAEENELLLTVCDTVSNRRSTDRPVTFAVQLTLSARRTERSYNLGVAAGNIVETQVKVVISPRRDRDRRREATVVKARRLLASLKAYLMAYEDNQEEREPASTEPASAE